MSSQTLFLKNKKPTNVLRLDDVSPYESKVSFLLLKIVKTLASKSETKNSLVIDSNV